MESLGNNIKRIRKQMGLTQEIIDFIMVNCPGEATDIFAKKIEPEKR